MSWSRLNTTPPCTAATSRALCDLIAEETGIAADRIYIEFTDAPHHMWGWNGDTF
jgi:phenylpyruvate tautomerase